VRTVAYRLVAVALIAAGLALTTEAFFTLPNILNILRQASLTFLIASGLTLTILTAGLDLSVGANVGLSACVAATVMKSSGSIAMGAATGLAFGAVVGMLNGLMVTVL
jgi:ribose transport system permease protein